MPEELIKHILKLREHLSDKGNYTIIRSDGYNLEFWELMTLGKLFYDIDKELEKQATKRDAENLVGCEVCGRLDGSHHSDCKYYNPRE